MKKLGMFLVLVAVSMFAIGCGKTDSKKSSSKTDSVKTEKTDTKTDTKTDKTEP